MILSTSVGGMKEPSGGRELGCSQGIECDGDDSGWNQISSLRMVSSHHFAEDLRK